MPLHSGKGFVCLCKVPNNVFINIHTTLRVEKDTEMIKPTRIYRESGTVPMNLNKNNITR